MPKAYANYAENLGLLCRKAYAYHVKNVCFLRRKRIFTTRKTYRYLPRRKRMLTVLKTYAYQAKNIFMLISPKTFYAYHAKRVCLPRQKRLPAPNTSAYHEKNVFLPRLKRLLTTTNTYVYQAKKFTKYNETKCR